MDEETKEKIKEEAKKHEGEQQFSSE